MGKKLDEFVTNIIDGFSEHKSEIFIGIGVASLLSAIGLAATATAKAVKVIEEEEITSKEELTNADKVKKTWKLYIPTAISAVVGTGSIFLSLKFSKDENALLAATCSLSESAIGYYKKEIAERLGEEKAKEIEDAVTEKRYNEVKKSDQLVTKTGKGDIICYDLVTGICFTTTKDTIEKAVNIMNFRLREEDYINFNEFYDELGIPRHTKFGNMFGWDIEDGYFDVDISTMLGDDGTPVLTIDYGVSRRYRC